MNVEVSTKQDLHTARLIVVEAQFASVALLQRRMWIGFARAAYLIDRLEEQGVIGRRDGMKPRRVLVKR